MDGLGDCCVAFCWCVCASLSVKSHVCICQEKRKTQKSDETSLKVKNRQFRLRWNCCHRHRRRRCRHHRMSHTNTMHRLILHRINGKLLLFFPSNSIFYSSHRMNILSTQKSNGDENSEMNKARAHADDDFIAPERLFRNIQ